MTSCTIIIVRMRTQSHVCENTVSSFCLYPYPSIDPGNPDPGKPQCLPHTTLTTLVDHIPFFSMSMPAGPERLHCVTYRIQENFTDTFWPSL